MKSEKVTGHCPRAWVASSILRGGKEVVSQHLMASVVFSERSMGEAIG